MALPVRKSYKGAPVTTTITTGVNDSATTVNVAAVTGWPTSFPYYAVIDPGTAKEEKVRVTNISTLQLTVVRAQDDTTAVSHDSAATIYPVFTAVEADEANQIASVMTTKGDIISTDGTTINRLAVGGTNTHVLQVDSAQTNGIKWGQVATAGIANGAVTPAKLSFDIAGVITAFGGSSAPTGWLLCDGSAVSRSTYADLFAVIGSTYGSGDGSTTFNVPNLKGKIPVGLDAAQTEFDTLAETGGAKTVTLDTTMIPSHAHTISAYSHSSISTADLSHTHGAGSYAVSSNTTGISASSSSAGSHQHNLNYSGRAGSTTTGYAIIDGTGFTGTLIKTAEAGDHSHTISISDPGHSHSFSGSSGSMSANSTHTHTIGDHASKDTASTGGGGAHNNLQPYLVVNYIIKH